MKISLSPNDWTKLRQILQRLNARLDSVSSSETSTASGGEVRKYIKVSDVKPAGTAGGTFSEGAWRTRDLNTIDAGGTIITLANNQITLPAGVYECQITCPAYRVRRNQSMLFNTTKAEVILLGRSAYCDATTHADVVSEIAGRFILTEQADIEVRHRCQSGHATHGFGVESDFDEDSIYTVAEFWKIEG